MKDWEIYRENDDVVRADFYYSHQEKSRSLQQTINLIKDTMEFVNGEIAGTWNVSFSHIEAYENYTKHVYLIVRGMVFL